MYAKYSTYQLMMSYLCAEGRRVNVHPYLPYLTVPEAVCTALPLQTVWLLRKAIYIQ
jgi:hypothetical protein